MTAKKPFEITSRPCIIDNVNLRTEKHGDDDMPAVDVRLSNIVIDKAELIRLTGDSEAWNLLFQQEKRGSVIEPTLQCFDSERYLVAKYEECQTKIRFGMQKAEHDFDDHKIKGISCKPLVGGMTAVTLTIQKALENTGICSDLAAYQGKEAHVEITLGKVSEKEKRQGKLPLNEGGDSDDKPSNRFGADEQPATH